MGEELEKLKVTVCDVSLEPRLGINGIELHVLKLNSKEQESLVLDKANCKSR